MFKNLKIGVKLLVIVVSFAIITVSVTSYVGIHTAKETTKNNQITMLEHIADLKVDKIESFFNERKGDIKVAQDYFNVKTNLPIVTRFASDRTNPAYITAKKMLDGQIKTFLNAYGCYVDFMLVSPEGKVVYTSNELHEEIDLDNPLAGPEGGKAFEKGKKGIYFTDVFYASKYEDYVYGILITAPASDFEGQFVGVIALELNMDPIYEFIQDTTGMGETGETLIGKKTEHGVLFLNSLRHDKYAALKRKALVGDESGFPILEAVQGRNGSGFSIDYRGK